MSWLELAEIDQKRWGVNGRVEFSFQEIGMRSVAALKKQTGYSLEEATVMAFDGKIVVQADGSEKVEKDPDALAALVWLVLYANGHRIPWDEFDPVPRGLKLDFSHDGEVEDAGKAPVTDGSNTTTDT